MQLEDLLASKKKEIAEDWFNRLVDTYPIDTSPFFKSQKDPFANPVGSTARSGIKRIVDELFGDMDSEAIMDALMPIVRIRAVQAMFTASQATGFIFLLKKSIRDLLDTEIRQYQLHEALLEFDLKIDDLALMGFNIFSECREKIAELRANELKDRTFKAFERAGLVADTTE